MLFKPPSLWCLLMTQTTLRTPTDQKKKKVETGGPETIYLGKNEGCVDGELGLESLRIEMSLNQPS